jgi:hypothetical protein
MPPAKIAARIFKIEPPRDPPYLLVEIDIDCPVCGLFTLALAGHHLRTIRDIVIEAIDLHPELASGAAMVVDQYVVKGKAPADPSSN